MEVPDFVELTKEMDIAVRFIEYMPFEGRLFVLSLDEAKLMLLYPPTTDNRWSTKKLVPSADLVSDLQTIHPNLQKLIDPHSDTTRTWRVPGYKGSVGFISSMSDHFCGECSRLRMGADGRVKVGSCLAAFELLSRS
jgi:molybdenum cofactor biosynthesis enzyme MoaA